MRLLRAFAPLAFLCAACGPQRVERHVALGCAGSTVESWLPDSSAALCLPTGFVARGRVGFPRPRGDTLPAHCIAVMVSRDPARPDGAPWPLTLAPLPFGAYPFLAITLLGWAWAHLRTRPGRNAAP